MDRRTPPPPPQGRERRQHERFELLAQVELRHGGDVSVLAVRDLSAGGLYVLLGDLERAAVHQGDVLGICVDLGDDDSGEALRLETEAEVVRVELPRPGKPGGIAMMWVTTEPEAAEALGRVLAHLRSSQAG